jgi:hypothetical protein
MGSILLFGKNKKRGIGFARKIFGIQAYLIKHLHILFILLGYKDVTT